MSTILTETLLSEFVTIFAKFLGGPLDTASILLQTQSFSSQLISGQSPRLNNPFEWMYKLVSEHGFFSLWDGQWFDLVRQIPVEWMNRRTKAFLECFFIKSIYKENSFILTLYDIFSGVFVGTISSFFIYPLMFYSSIRSTDIINNHPYSGFSDFIQQTYSRDGLSGLYTGFAPYICGMTVYRASYISSYVTFLNKKNWGSSGLGHLQRFATSQFVAVLANIAAYPLSTVSMALRVQTTYPQEQRLFNGAFGCISYVYNTEGITGFFGGVMTHTLKLLLVAFALVFFDSCKIAIFQIKNEKK